MNNQDHIFRELNFWVKILKFFDADPGSGMEKIRIQDGKMCGGSGSYWLCAGVVGSHWGVLSRGCWLPLAVCAGYGLPLAVSMDCGIPLAVCSCGY